MTGATAAQYVTVLMASLVATVSVLAYFEVVSVQPVLVGVAVAGGLLAAFLAGRWSGRRDVPRPADRS